MAARSPRAKDAENASFLNTGMPSASGGAHAHAAAEASPDRVTWALFWKAALLVTVIWAASAVLLYWSVEDFSKSGTFGDSFGVLNTLFSGLAFAGIIVSIKMQNDEMREQRKELQKQKKAAQIYHRERMRNEDGAFLGNVFVLRDITEMKRLQADAQRNDRLAALGHLAAGVAHEIRNPLSTIKGVALYIAKRMPLGGREEEAAQRMIDEVERLDRVVSELLEFARPGSFETVQADLGEVIGRALRLAEADLKAKNIAVVFEMEPGFPLVRISTERLTQALLNLFLNAVQAMDHGGTLRVSTRALPEGLFSITVADTGPGIPVEIQASIFTPYFTTKSSGTGLGLAIVYQIAEGHGGRVSVGNAPGHAVFQRVAPVRQSLLHRLLNRPLGGFFMPEAECPKRKQGPLSPEGLAVVSFGQSSMLHVKEHFQIFTRERLPGVLTGNDGFRHAALGFLQFENLLFHRVLADELVGEDLTGLTDTVGTVCGLTFHCGVPPRVVVDNVVGGGQVEARAASLERDQEDRNLRRVVELVYLIETVFARAVEVAEGNLRKFQPLLDDLEHLHKLREDEHLVAAFHNFHDHGAGFQCSSRSGAAVANASASDWRDETSGLGAIP